MFVRDVTQNTARAVTDFDQWQIGPLLPGKQQTSDSAAAMRPSDGRKDER